MNKKLNGKVTARLGQDYNKVRARFFQNLPALSRMLHNQHNYILLYNPIHNRIISSYAQIGAYTPGAYAVLFMPETVEIFLLLINPSLKKTLTSYVYYAINKY
jgi:hypothetical protein